MRPAALVALGAVAFALSLVATVPARLVAARLAQDSGGRVQVFEASGTAWSGEAQALVATPAGPLPLDRVSWRWRPASLLAGRMAFAATVETAGTRATAELGRTLEGYELRGLEGSAAAEAVVAVLPWLAPWQPRGALAARVERLAWNGREIVGDAALEWRDAGLSMSPVRPLGHYRAEVVGEGAQARVTVTTLGGPLRIAGKGTYAPAAGLAFAGEARGEGESARALDPLLDLMGPRRADGARILDWRLR